MGYDGIRRSDMTTIECVFVRIFGGDLDFCQKNVLIRIENL